MLKFIGKATVFLRISKKVVGYAKAISELLDKVVQPFEQFMDDIRELEGKGGNE